MSSDSEKLTRIEVKLNETYNALVGTLEKQGLIGAHADTKKTLTRHLKNHSRGLKTLITISCMVIAGLIIYALTGS